MIDDDGDSDDDGDNSCCDYLGEPQARPQDRDEDGDGQRAICGGSGRGEAASLLGLRGHGRDGGCDGGDGGADEDPDGRVVGRDSGGGWWVQDRAEKGKSC